MLLIAASVHAIEMFFELITTDFLLTELMFMFCNDAKYGSKCHSLIEAVSNLNVNLLFPYAEE
ncbi:MAG: hypothetical protein M1480_01640 [Bacteroidetes bacterium]|nr:hypothetical protein [Bacteroidota bacterium]